jgi:predicted glycosyltransferase/glycosyltransferase involved in cell wall biosynthesis
MSALSSLPAALVDDGALHAVGGSKRFLFYSNEMVGLGHLRRTLSIAGCLTDAHEEASSLILTGCAVEPFFRLPARTDTVKLPIRRRDADGTHHSRLLLDIDELRSMRAQIALATATAFDPDVAIIDKLPLGLGGELELTLESLRARRPRCKVVLGLRDIDDSADNVRAKWGPDMREVIERYYDAVVVYGPRSTPDALRCMGWDGLDIPVVHVGYVGAPSPTEGPLDLPDGYLLATAGAGNDGFALLASVAAAIRAEPLPCPTVMVAGPLMDPADLECLRQLTDGLDIKLCEFRNDLPNLIVGARGIVAMAGYNTVGEIMRARKPALFVPRVRPSEEQLIRARMLDEAGLQQMLHPDDMDPGSMRRALGSLLARRRPSFHAAEYTGSERAAELLAAVGGLTPRTPARKVLPLRRPKARVAIIASGFPRLSETFALNELRALDEQGRLAALFATKPGDPGAAQPGTASLMERLEVLPDVSPLEQAAIVAERLRDQGVTGVHGYFAHTPAEVAMNAARALDLPYGFSVHAADARKVTPEALAERVRGAACVIACNTDVAAALGAGHEHVHLIRHGVDVTRFSCAAPPGAEPLRLLAVGRLVEKKGFDILIGAAARLTVPFSLRIVGDGPLREPLSRLIRDYGLADRVELCGTRTHAQLPSEYAAADLVVVPSVIDGRGDRDGLPNVVLEAMASTRPVVASDVADLGSAVIDGRTGLLVPPGDPTALAAALDSLLHRAELRRALGAEGRRRVETEFELGRSTERFVTALEAAYV